MHNIDNIRINTKHNCTLKQQSYYYDAKQRAKHKHQTTTTTPTKTNRTPTQPTTKPNRHTQLHKTTHIQIHTIQNRQNTKYKHTK